MLYFPNAKINLGLHVTERRPDGYHNIETIFYPIPLCDILEITPIECQSGVQFVTSGIEIGGNNNDNLVLKAFRKIAGHEPKEGWYIHLHKIIPMGAGLGGGSADAAFCLKGANKQLMAGLSDEKLAEIATTIGADCPFFIYNTPMMATGIGDILSPVAVSLAGYYILLVKPDIHVSTPMAYSKITPKPASTPLSEIIQRPVEEWKNVLVNDFEPPVFELFPPIAHIKQQMYDMGASYAAMSGSGSTVFGLFRAEPAVENLFEGCFVWNKLL